eukprot:3464962-Prymnesium_polylepis.1
MARSAARGAWRVGAVVAVGRRWRVAHHDARRGSLPQQGRQRRPAPAQHGTQPAYAAQRAHRGEGRAVGLGCGRAEGGVQLKGSGGDGGGVELR